MRKCFEALGIIGSAASIIGLILTCLNSAGITLPAFLAPLAATSFFWLPILCFCVGIVIGSGITIHRIDEEKTKAAAVEAEKQKGETERERIRAEEAEAKRAHDVKQAEAERTRKKEEEKAKDARFNQKLIDFPAAQKALLFDAVTEGTVTTRGEETIEAQSLEADGLLTKLGKKGLAGQAWKPTDLTRDFVHEENIELWDELQGASSKRKIEIYNERLDRQMTSFLDLSFDQRFFAYRVWKDGYFDFNHWKIQNSGYDSGVLDEQDIGDGISRFTIKGEYKNLFKERESQCFEAVEAWIESQNEEE